MRSHAEPPAPPRPRPTTKNGTVPPRRTRNAARRPREHLTPEEVRRLTAAAKARPGRHGHRDATLIPYFPDAVACS